MTATVTDADGNSATKTISVFVANETLPAAPTALSATAGASRIDLTWQDVSDNESGFKIERSRDNVTFTQVATTGANVTSYADATAAVRVKYFYRVRAFNAAGDSAYSNTATATITIPAKPTSLTATTASGPRRVILGWTDNSANESGFRIYRSRSNQPFTLIGTVGPNVTTFTDGAVAASNLYSYRVRAYNNAGSSGDSNTASVIIMSP